ncbi:1,6-anhydro-N-acetylmuramyl-L-alanine amidase AmpD [Pseudoalteromonas sp. JBTF-M23]|uniref:1,6-anhydro-N-acetylmuramyl-L-alanine amidase AmpD n=1 Tax=Pseudoalteromonas caenipelagi TaxID=2726988 RepID=A0A849VDY5_9GAMM|nr:1,6-anhydro-N-acetylmuramyl-L-alanine amidase AmpD [Pseudoalteromonas caenipelagi]NOU51602.1 1,6-anhydro-N-acetylmuramyl-L-alanine amidase AmpD [Pseudoalteromonas caenipelagi]
MSLDWLADATRRPCTFYDDRPEQEEISLLVIHNISLPAGQFGTPYVDALFSGSLDCNAHPSFADLEGVRVSAHCFIRRDGQVLQYVPFNKRAWHAGVSSFAGRERCNDFSIGIELEGTDNEPYHEAQYRQLAAITKQLMAAYPAISKQRIVGHCDIAPGRKTDPGNAFQWSQFFNQLEQ